MTREAQYRKAPEELSKRAVPMADRSLSKGYGPANVPSVVHDVLRSPGEPLDAALRAYFEPRFSHDFSQVRVHAGTHAGASAAALQAKAYSIGNRIVLGAGCPSFMTQRGRWLLAHELAHVSQIQPGAGNPATSAVEADAGRAATAVVAGGRANVQQRHGGTRIHRFGEPENVPDITYISTQGEQGFLNSAVAYHQAWGLAPRRISSIEQLLGNLARGRGRLGRVRIVLHAAEIGMFSSFFTNEPRFSLQAGRLDAYAQSDIAGLAHDVGNWLAITPTITAAILRHLRSNHPGMLKPFRLEERGTPTGTLATLVQRATELQMLSGARTRANARQADPIIAAVTTLLAELRQRLQSEAGLTRVQALALQNAIRAAGLIFGGVQFDVDRSRQVAQANRAIGAGFRGTLNAVRQRFDAGSWIDIRGCNVGDNPAYLRSVSHFFGRPGFEPHVSGPEWYQVFPFLGARTLANDAAVDSLAGNAHVQTALNRWSVLTGARAQLEALRSFYRTEIVRRQMGAETEQSRFLQLQLPGIPPLFGGLPTPSADRVMTNLLQMPSPLQMPPPLQLSDPVPLVARPRFPGGNYRFEDPRIDMARRALARLNRPGAELHYYFDAELVLPAYVGPGQQDIRLYMLHPLRRRAMANWLACQWSSAAPGLRALQSGAWNAVNSRRVTALTQTQDEGAPAGAEMVFPPDPRYRQHIREV